jgi:hypothetical protein
MAAAANNPPHANARRLSSNRRQLLMLGVILLTALTLRASVREFDTGDCTYALSLSRTTTTTKEVIADFWMPVVLEDKATPLAKTEVDMSKKTNALVAANVSTALVVNQTNRNAQSQSSAPRKVHADHSHAAVTTTLSHTNADATTATTTTTEAEPIVPRLVSNNVGVDSDDYETQLSSLRTHFAKFEKDLEQISNHTQISLLQSRLAKIEQNLEQVSVSKAEDQSSQLSVSEQVLVPQYFEQVSVSESKEQSSQLSMSEETASDYRNDFSRILKGEKVSEETFSACLLIMDDNHRLSEWIAYHYFAMPLRHLVVTVDPRSRTSPVRILDRWRPLMNITLWGDGDFNFKANMTALNETDSQAKTNMHRKRQAVFYKDCALYLQKKKETWTTFHDVDEFLTVDKHFVNDTETLLKTLGNVLQTLSAVRSTELNNTHFQKNCITVPRVTYGSVESSTEEVQMNVPSFLDGMKFDTLRYRHRGKHGSGGPVKSILDVTHAIKGGKYAIHQIIGDKHCSSKHTSHNILGIHHYMGSWESYSYRDDARRGKEHSRKRFNERANVKSVRNDDEIRPWVQGFVDYVGEPLAKYLLQDAGEFDDKDGYVAAT